MLLQNSGIQQSIGNKPSDKPSAPKKDVNFKSMSGPIKGQTAPPNQQQQQPPQRGHHSHHSQNQHNLDNTSPITSSAQSLPMPSQYGASTNTGKLFEKRNEQHKLD